MYGSTGTGKTMLVHLHRDGSMQERDPCEVLPDSLAHQPAFRGSGERQPCAASQESLDKADILILDEFGYVPYNRTGAQLLFDYLSEIHERKSLSLIQIWSFPDG